MNDLFKQNKYATWYFNIVSQAKSRAIPGLGYTEKHHIVPKSLGGDNSLPNIVVLTGREHYLCHRLLIRMVENPVHKRSMGWALHRMLFSATKYHDRFLPNSRLFEKVRSESIEARSSVPYSRTPEHQAKINAANTARLKDTTFSEETRAKMSASRTGTKNGMFNRNHDEKSIELMRENKKGKPVSVHGVAYNKMIDAENATGMKARVIKHMISKGTPGFFFL